MTSLRLTCSVHVRLCPIFISQKLRVTEAASITVKRTPNRNLHPDKFFQFDLHQLFIFNHGVCKRSHPPVDDRVGEDYRTPATFFGILVTAWQSNCLLPSPDEHENAFP